MSEFSSNFGNAIKAIKSGNNPISNSSGRTGSISNSSQNRDPTCVCYYETGPYVDEVKMLLNAPGISGTFKYHSSMSKPDGNAPSCPKNDNCMRDIYVCAAVQYAWAAEAYAYVGEQAKAEDAANQMHGQLASAKGLCSDKPGEAPGQECKTQGIFNCQ
jgi:hypothetical protein